MGSLIVQTMRVISKCHSIWKSIASFDDVIQQATLIKPKKQSHAQLLPLIINVSVHAMQWKVNIGNNESEANQ